MLRFKEFIPEAKAFQKAPFLILENPRAREFENMLRKDKFDSVRLLVLNSPETWYIWEGSDDIHYNVSNMISEALGLEFIELDKAFKKNYFKRWSFSYFFESRPDENIIFVFSDLEKINMAKFKSSKAGRALTKNLTATLKVHPLGAGA